MDAERRAAMGSKQVVVESTTHGPDPGLRAIHKDDVSQQQHFPPPPGSAPSYSRPPQEPNHSERTVIHEQSHHGHSSDPERPKRSRNKSARDEGARHSGDQYRDPVSSSDQRGIKKSMRNEEPRDHKGRGNASSMFSKIGRLMNGTPGAYPDDFDDGHQDYFRPADRHRGNDDRDPRVPVQLIQELDRLRQENTALRTDLQMEQQKLVGVVQSADRIQKNMDNKELFLQIQASDSELKAEFRGLLNSMRSLVSKLERGTMTRPEIQDESIRDELEAVAPGCLSKDLNIWTDGKRLRMLMRGWIGLVATRTIFRNRSGTQEIGTAAMDQWMPSVVQNAVATIEDRLSYASATDQRRITNKSLHDWRSLTIDLISKLDLGPGALQETDAFVQDRAKRMMSVMEHFAPPDYKNEVYRGLLQILNSSIQFSRVLRKQRALWSVVGPSIPGPASGAIGQVTSLTKFDPNWMEDDLADDDDDDDFGNDNSNKGPKYVEIFMTPSLIRRGNADGEGYEHATPVVPMLVICKKT